MVTVESKEITARQDMINFWTPTNVQTLVDGGMTKEVMSNFATFNTVYMELTQPTEAYEAVRALVCGPEPDPVVEPYEYDLAELKARLDQGEARVDKHKMLADIIWEAQGGISQCDAFDLFVHADPWRTLRDLMSVDPWRTNLDLVGPYKAVATP